MSSQFKPFGEPTEPSAEEAFTASPSSLRVNPRALKSIVAGAAAVAVLGGGTLGFLWLSSTPGGDDALAATPGSASVPSVTAPTSAGASPVAFAASGRNIFAGTLGTTGSSEVVSGSTSASAVQSTAASVGSPAQLSPAASTGGSAGAATGGGTPARTTTSPKPAAPAPSTSSTPTPVRSTALPWLRGTVKFVEFPEGSTDGRAKFILDADSQQSVPGYLSPGGTIPSTSTVFRPQGTKTTRSMTQSEIDACKASVKAATAAQAEEINRKSDNCSTVEAFVWQAVFVPNSQASAASTNTQQFGWLAQPGAVLADAALGKVTGTVRWLGQGGDKYLVQVGNNTPQWVARGDTVKGSPLTFEGIGLDSIVRPDVAVFSNGDNKYFTVLGAGEGSGVTF